jgi:hypothetical protein
MTPVSPSGEEICNIASTILPDLQQEASETETNTNSTTTSHYNTNNNNNQFTTTENRLYYSDYYDGDTEPFQIHPHIPAPTPTLATSPETKLNDTQKNNNNKKKTKE